MRPTVEFFHFYVQKLAFSGGYWCSVETLNQRLCSAWIIFKDNWLQGYKKSARFTAVKGKLKRQGTRTRRYQTIPDVGCCVHMIILKCQEFINPDGSYRSRVKLTDLRNIAYITTKFITRWRRSQVYGMFAFLSFNEHYETNRGRQKGVFLQCYGGKGNFQSWSVPVKVEELEFPYDPFRILFLWRMYVLHRVHERKVPAVSVWTPGTRF